MLHIVPVHVNGKVESQALSTKYTDDSLNIPLFDSILLLKGQTVVARTWSKPLLLKRALGDPTCGLNVSNISQSRSSLQQDATTPYSPTLSDRDVLLTLSTP